MTGKLEVGAACAIVGASALSIHQIYTQHAGTLSDARTATAGDPVTRQRLADADILTGGVVLIVGGAMMIVARRGEPLILAGLLFILVAGYYHFTVEQSPVTGSSGVDTGSIKGSVTQSDYTATDQGSTDYTYDSAADSGY